ncbi:MAG TPA: pyridoxal-phosphate dependent enzyme [Xanthomonadales bacterium]|nr:pyridoxal-phosphate dependent enzyme [Xanthomonadales bacterium]
MNTNPKADLPDITDVHLAWTRIRDQTTSTPVLLDPDLDEWAGCRLAVKCENLQRTGSFKFRGASNAILSLEEANAAEFSSDNKRAVATHSSGNHGAALALAARLNNRAAHVVMPQNSVPAKIDAVRRYGGTVHFCEDNHSAREAGLEELVDQGMIPIHPFDRREIIAGQGSCALELFADHPQIDVLVVPVGGGGLISGCALAAAAQGVTVIGVEPEGAAETVASLDRGQRVVDLAPDTIADGLRAVIGVRNFEMIRSLVENVVTVTDGELRAAQSVAWKLLRQVIEPSSATVIAAITRYPELFADKHVGMIISGGNVLLDDWIDAIREHE